MQMTVVQAIMSDKKTRLKELRLKLELKQSEFADKIGSNQSNIAKMENGKQPIGKNIEYKILNTYGINHTWWETGNGEMFLTKNQEPTNEPQEISGPRSVRSYILDELVKVPLLDVNARAGFVENLENYQEYIENYTYVLPDRGTKYDKALAIRVDGDSMEPRLERGDVVLAFFQESSEWEYLNPGIYAIVYRNSFVIKRIKKNTLQQTGELELHSDNEIHGTILVKSEDIRAIWKVSQLVERRLH